MKELVDITVIGGGPTGLFAAFYAGMRGRSVRIVDSLPELGGQLTALYPEKHIFDVGGFPRVLAKDLARSLIDQALQFDPEVVLDEEIREVLTQEDGTLLLRGRNGDLRTRALVIAAGKGAFEPMRLDCPGYDDFLGRGVHYSVLDPERWRDRTVVLVGGGDSALDWTLILKDVCARTVLVHRRDGFRAHERSVELLHEAVGRGEVEFLPFHEVREISGDDRVRRTVVFDNRSGSEREILCDGVLSFLGFKPDLGPILNWGLELGKNRIRVDHLMRTNRAGVFAAGDIVEYDGKLDLIVTGFSEAALAVNHAVHHVDPKARVNPGHSTSLAVFKDKEKGE